VSPEAIAAFLCVSANGILAQSTSPSDPTIKLSGPYASGVTFRSVNHHLVVDNHTLKECIGFAYNLSPRLVSGGPAWIGSERYDMVAEIPSDGSLSLTLQALLADRFKLQFHRQQSYSPVYNLIIGQSDLKIKQSTLGATGPHAAYVNISPPPSVATLPARNATMAEFAGLLQRMVVNRPVIDKTGLSGRYNFDLEWTPGKATPDSKPDIFTAVQQLGLELVPAEALLDTIVVDYVERPTGN
jgi:uncharacterized protein (TIGR03435 family)